jgi:hypothetical protein
MMYDEQEIDKYYDKLESLIARARVTIVQNPDDVGFDSWRDANDRSRVNHLS